MAKTLLQVTKLDAARRQLETTIHLYFYDGDPVSMHTLMGAAYTILHDLLKKSDHQHKMLVKDMLMKHVKPGLEKKLINMLNQAENFFKHADRDQGETIELNSKSTEFRMFDAIVTYTVLSGEQTVTGKLFQGWFTGHHMDMFIFNDDELHAMQTAASEMSTMSKSNYFDLMLPHATSKIYK